MKYAFQKYLKSYLLRLFWLFLTITLVVCIYVFYHHETHLFGFTLLNPFYDFIADVPVWVYIVLCSTFISILSIIIFISFSLYFNIQKSRIARLRAKYYKYFSYLLTNYFLSDFYKNEPFKKNLRDEIESHLRNRFQLLAILESYLKLQETVAINLSDDFKQLMKSVSIQKRIESLIFSEGFDDKILAMKVLSYLNIHSCDEQIINYSQSSNFALRTEAYAALVRLMEKDEHLIKFIGKNHNLSMLDINIIVNAVLKNHKMSIDYQALLSSENPRKIMVGLLLAKYRYKKNRNNLILIINYIGNSNLEFNKLAWDALLTLVPEDELVDVIIDRFESEPEDVQILILEKLNNLINKRLYNYLKSIITHQTLLVKIEALKMIFKNDFDDLSIYDNSQNEEMIMAYKEVSCVYLNN